MEIVHVDPGYGRFMETNNDLTWVENSEYNPYSGVAFITVGSSGARAHFPNVDFTFEPTSTFYKKVWSLKFSFYSDGLGILHAGFARAFTATSADVGVSLSSNTCSFLRYVNNVATTKYNAVENFGAGFHNVAITLALSVESGSYIRTSTIDVDGVVDYQTCTSSTALTAPSYLLLSFGSGKHYYISNVLVGQAFYEGDGTGDIPSDDGIPADTPIYRLPLGTPVTNFTKGEDGEYIGTANGQTLLQAVNANNLIETFGDQSVNHIVTYGNPGYRVGSAVSHATGISKSGDNITSHGTHELSFDKTAHVYDVWSIGDGTAFSDINGLQVGWRAGG